MRQGSVAPLCCAHLVLYCSYTANMAKPSLYVILMLSRCQRRGDRTVLCHEFIKPGRSKIFKSQFRFYVSRLLRFRKSCLIVPRNYRLIFKQKSFLSTTTNSARCLPTATVVAKDQHSRAFRSVRKSPAVTQLRWPTSPWVPHKKLSEFQHTVQRLLSYA